MDRWYNAKVFLLGSWILIGLVVDIALHTQGNGDSFWSIPHFITNSGIIAIIISTVWFLLRNHGKDRLPLKSLGMLGVIVFILGGIGDIILHLMDVSETSFFSRPTHVLILLGGGLYICAIAKQK